MSTEQTPLTPQAQQLLQQTALFLRQQQAYLVGGSVRNLLLGEPGSDWDIATDGDVPPLARGLANALGGYYAHLHDRASRITVKHDSQESIIDLSPLHENDIAADLRERDFTINALAIPLQDAVLNLRNGSSFPLIDPLHGEADLQTRTLRAVDERIFQRDPLRMLRAIRFMQRYQLTIEPTTAHMLTRDADQLLRAAPERIHDELYAILRPNGATTYLRVLDSYGLLTVLIPELISARGMRQPELHFWDVFEHSVESAATLERLTTLLQDPTQAGALPGAADLSELHTLLNEAEQQHLFRWSELSSPPLKLAALLHDIGKPVTYARDEEGHITFYHHPQAGVPLAQQIMQRIAASTADRRLVSQVVAHHMRPGQLSQTDITTRAVRRYFVDLGPVGIQVALVSLADHLAMRGPTPLTEHWSRHLATVRLLLTRYIRERTTILPPRLVQAEELIRHFELTPGPLIGQILDQLAEAQAEGRVRSKADALWLAEEFLKHH